MKEKMIRLIKFLFVIVWFFNTIGTSAYLIWAGQWHFAIANIIIAVSIFPSVKNVFQGLMN